jgi:hypothetical protein
MLVLITTSYREHQAHWRSERSPGGVIDGDRLINLRPASAFAQIVAEERSYSLYQWGLIACARAHLNNESDPDSRCGGGRCAHTDRPYTKDHTGGDRRLRLAGAIGGPLSLLAVAIAEPEVKRRSRIAASLERTEAVPNGHPRTLATRSLNRLRGAAKASWAGSIPIHPRHLGAVTAMAPDVSASGAQ